MPGMAMPPPNFAQGGTVPDPQGPRFPSITPHVIQETPQQYAERIQAAMEAAERGYVPQQRVVDILNSPRAVEDWAAKINAVNDAVTINKVSNLTPGTGSIPNPGDEPVIQLFDYVRRFVGVTHMLGEYAVQLSLEYGPLLPVSLTITLIPTVKRGYSPTRRFTNEDLAVGWGMAFDVWKEQVKSGEWALIQLAEEAGVTSEA